MSAAPASTLSAPPVIGQTPFVRVRGLRKSFGGVQALKGVDLDAFQGEVHGLVGANGAGKSTLIRVLAGLVKPDEGAVSVDGRPVHIHDPKDSSRLGLSFIHQELNLVPKFNAIQNITLGAPRPSRLASIDWAAVERSITPILRKLGIDFPLNTPVEKLSVVEQWLVSIARALVREARFIAMDEPTASLSKEESERLFGITRDLASHGIAIVYVSHRLDEILALCDRVTVFKDGERTLHTERRGLTKESLVQAIVGRQIEVVEHHAPVEGKGPAVLEVRDLARQPSVRGVNLTARGGEVLGLAGLVGAGRTELARLIFGADRPRSGTMTLDGRPYQPRDPADAVKQGVVLVPEERRSEGLVLEKSVAFNLNLPALEALRFSSLLPLTSPARGRARAAEVARRLQVKTPSMDTPVRQLSGGNQQKIVIGKWLTGSPRLVILDEPSRGVDVGARAEIHNIIRDLADQGAAVIVISSDDEELPGLCDRVLVMVEGRISGELRGNSITREAIMHLSYAHDSVQERVT
jgi:ribose transport system ATP-binding protein